MRRSSAQGRRFQPHPRPPNDAPETEGSGEAETEAPEVETATSLSSLGGAHA
jgi:hypothetical protein